MLGIDVSKKDLQCTLRNPNNKAILWEMKVQNSAKGMETLLRRTPSAIPWVLEPTGRYSIEVAQQARQAGRQQKIAQCTANEPKMAIAKTLCTIRFGKQGKTRLRGLTQ